MNNNDNGLLGFLKKKSLFANSPLKNSRKRSRSKSRDSKNFDQKSGLNSFQQRSIEQSIQHSRKGNPILLEDKNHYDDRNEPSRLNFYNPQNNVNYHFSTPQGKNNQRILPDNESRATERTNGNKLFKHFRDSGVSSDVKSLAQNNLWGGLVSHTNSFESARLESSQCLQNLSMKVGSQISNINYKIEVFNSKMGRILTNEFKAVRDKINQILEAAFKESEKCIKQYMQKKEQQMAGQLHKMKSVLQQEQTKIETMKDQLTKPQWRKVAGQILSSELETKIEEIVKKSHELEIGHWELGDISSHRMKNIENELKDIVRLKST